MLLLLCSTSIFLTFIAGDILLNLTISNTWNSLKSVLWTNNLLCLLNEVKQFWSLFIVHCQLFPVPVLHQVLHAKQQLSNCYISRWLSFYLQELKVVSLLLASKYHLFFLGIITEKSIMASVRTCLVWHVTWKCFTALKNDFRGTNFSFNFNQVMILHQVT